MPSDKKLEPQSLSSLPHCLELMTGIEVQRPRQFHLILTMSFREIWGNQRCDWSWVPSVGTSGKLIYIWNEEVLVMEDVLLADRVLLSRFEELVMGLFGLLPMSMGQMCSLSKVIF